MKNKILLNVLRWFYRIIILKYKNKKQNAVFLKEGLDTLLEINNVFEELKIIYWLEYGTLLGAIRDKSFISHDLDIDLGLLLSDYSPLIEQRLTSRGFKKTRKISIDNGVYGIEETYLYKGVSIDFFYFSKRNNKLYTHCFSKDGDKTWAQTVDDLGGYVVRELVFNDSGFMKYNFMNNIFYVPKDFNSHLEDCYGPNYMIKDPLWDSSKTKNVTVLTNKIGVVHNYE